MMKYVDVGGVRSSRVVLGAMRYADKPIRQIEDIIVEALKAGANTFDHADIYGKGDSETVFGLAMKDLELKEWAEHRGFWSTVERIKSSCRLGRLWRTALSKACSSGMKSSLL